MKEVADDIFSMMDSEISISDDLEIKTEGDELMSFGISSLIGGERMITLGFSYFESLEERDDCVDLGLSVRWATTNLGAKSPTDVGGFYSFSETNTKDEYWRENYSYCNNNANQYIFVYTNPSVNICDSKYDAATVKLGDGWKMPNLIEVNELITNCQWEKESVDGVNVFRVTGPNGNSIIIPIIGLKKQRKDYSTNKLHLAVGECSSTGSEDCYVLTSEVQKAALTTEWKAWGYNIRPVYVK